MTDKERKWTNAMEQILPQFYREKDIIGEPLIICVDRFSPDELAKNKAKIAELDANIIIYNSDATIQSLEEFISYMTTYLSNRNYPIENIIIANYVRYVSPNHTENFFEENIPKVIYKGLNESYRTRFYQWYGYQPNTYNLLYNYDQYQYMIGYGKILSILDGIYGHESLSYSNLYMIKESGKNAIYLEMFLKNSMDIGSPYEISLYDYFTNGQI